jgi:hypothetical protein
MLLSILRQERRFTDEPAPVSWKDIDYGPTTHERPGDTVFFTARGQWNIEQALRRALRSLEQRGLVTLDRYVFRAEPVQGLLSPQIKWFCVDSDHHVPGDSRYMTGVLLTEAGRHIATLDEAASKRRRARRNAEA